jgi:hypothetical protein
MGKRRQHPDHACSSALPPRAARRAYGLETAQHFSIRRPRLQVLGQHCRRLYRRQGQAATYWQPDAVGRYRTHAVHRQLRYFHRDSSCSSSRTIHPIRSISISRFMAVISGGVSESSSAALAAFCGVSATRRFWGDWQNSNRFSICAPCAHPRERYAPWENYRVGPSMAKRDTNHPLPRLLGRASCLLKRRCLS